jgi:hypothetical protein
VTLPARLRAHDPAAIRDVYAAITASRGVLADIGAALGLTGTSSTRSVQAARLVALAGLDEQLAAVQIKHGTGRAGRRPTGRVRLTVQITGAPLEVLSQKMRAACVDDRDPGAPWAMAELELDASGRVRGRLVRAG